jgi:hypothetical protein
MMAGMQSSRKSVGPKLPDDPAEYQRFLDMAREVKADVDPKALDRAFEKVMRPSRQKAQKDGNA